MSKLSLRKFLFPLFTFSSVLYFSCNKNSVRTPTLRTTADSIATLTNSWTSYQDSVSNNNYFNFSGYPISGVLYNPPGDYWNFKADGNIDILLEGVHFATTYRYLGKDKILITGLPAELTKPCTITTLNANTFIFITTDTVASGTYYRRVWLKR